MLNFYYSNLLIRSFRHTGNKVNYMKKFILLVTLIVTAAIVKAQKIDSIYFHLYTDSLKKGTYNYINVDGKLSNGNWRPLTVKDIDFSSSTCEFSGNELIVPADFSKEKVTVKAVLKSNPTIWKETTIWIKKLPDPELPSNKIESMQDSPKRKNRRN